MNRLRELRDKKGWTLDQVADSASMALNGLDPNSVIDEIAWEQSNVSSQDPTKDQIFVSANSISQYERGDRNPKLEVLSALADVFEVSTDYLMGRTNDENNYYVKLLDRLESRQNEAITTEDESFYNNTFMLLSDADLLKANNLITNDMQLNRFNGDLEPVKFQKLNAALTDKLHSEVLLAEQGKRDSKANVSDLFDNLSPENYSLIKNLLSILKKSDELKKENIKLKSLLHQKDAYMSSHESTKKNKKNVQITPEDLPF
ncbi:helix-turn-helix domain-containing protein [Oenococcus sicerae]|uniref:XRE family transcriptional regulator n=1 Tax=Oenococcus sicerae TaxID=2203724 RepID=A0AAJ1VPL6_9LACO|nr:helix-turn-helix transcriptional regulator [Oenococcus sicerae]MDN6900939.1 XRE family transcriptional regulator [Oenococcus sicerae]